MRYLLLHKPWRIVRSVYLINHVTMICDEIFPFRPISATDFSRFLVGTRSALWEWPFEEKLEANWVRLKSSLVLEIMGLSFYQTYRYNNYQSFPFKDLVLSKSPINLKEPSLSLLTSLLTVTFIKIMSQFT